MSDKTIKTAVGKAMTIDTAKRTLTAMITTRNVDRDGDIVEPEGIDTTNFEKNPVVLWAHNSYEMPIAKIEKLYKSPQGILADIKFAEHSLAKDVFNLYSEGFLNAWSIGFVGQKGAVEPRLDEDGRIQGYLFNKTELLELSAVPIPANPDALTRSFGDMGKDTLATMRKCFETLPEILQKDAEAFVVALKSTEEQTDEVEKAEAKDKEQIEAPTETPVEEDKKEEIKSYIATFKDDECIVTEKDGEVVEMAVRETAFDKSFAERGAKGSVPTSVQFTDTPSTAIEFVIVQEKDGEVVEAKVTNVEIALPLTKEVDTPEEKNLQEETEESETEGRVEDAKEEDTTSEESEADEISKAQEEQEGKSVKEEAEAGSVQEDRTLELKQKLLMLRARCIDLG